MKKRESLWTVGGNVIDPVIMGNSMGFPHKLKVEPPCDPAAPFLGIYPKEMESLT